MTRSKVAGINHGFISACTPTSPFGVAFYAISFAKHKEFSKLLTRVVNQPHCYHFLLSGLVCCVFLSLLWVWLSLLL